MRIAIQMGGKTFGDYQCFSYSITLRKVDSRDGPKVHIKFVMDRKWGTEAGFLELEQEVGRWLAHALLSVTDPKTMVAEISTELREETKVEITKA